LGLVGGRVGSVGSAFFIRLSVGSEAAVGPAESRKNVAADNFELCLLDC